VTFSPNTIGVAVSPAELWVAEEFFELFKTPWERAVPGRKYGVVLSTTGSTRGLDADVFVVYSSQEQSADLEARVAVGQAAGPVDVEWSEWTFPVYGRLALFVVEKNACGLRSGDKAIGYEQRSEGRRLWRIGYDLFSEVGRLLNEGQPASRALTPTLELHIALLRHLLWQSEVPFVEVLPRPEGYDFICCLTHDVDFFGVRRHRFDRTLLGFVARASLGTWADLVRGRRSAADVVRNLKALLSLPFVFLGLTRDFWRPFEDYARVEDPTRSTFFLVPFKDRPGVAPDGTVDARRGVRYQLCDIPAELKDATARGSELGLHGIDAWRSAEAGREEKLELTSITNQQATGVRMHWLYFSADAPRQLEAAGFAYDSTCGYNEAVGYRAGTSQVFRLPGTERFMELPLSIMDSALFAHDRMPLRREHALAVCRQIISQARMLGGTVVINWHCRSLAPERLWGEAYRDLLAEVGRGDRAWFARAGAAVEWFRWRRSIRFSEGLSRTGGLLRVMAASSTHPAGVIRTYRPGPTGTEIRDLPIDGGTPVDVDIQSRALSL
jgi:hypothetical protein